jgi:phosphatidylethanolamine/phosphatidyl-N-methylethanolamine N-methyltransferase
MNGSTGATGGFPALTPTLDDARHRTTTAVEAVYRRLAPVYDVIYGIGLEHGRRCAMRRLAPQPGEWILEVGVGTGLSARDYPPYCRIAGVDLSEQMLARARTRLTRRRLHHVSLCRMDASVLAFADGRFDAVYAPYVLNVVADPVRVVTEMLRVCRVGGRLVLLNHFAPEGGEHPGARLVWNVAARLAGVNWHVELAGFLRAVGLAAVSVDEVNFGVSSVVVCRKRLNLCGVRS